MSSAPMGTSFILGLPSKLSYPVGHQRVPGCGIEMNHQMCSDRDNNNVEDKESMRDEETVWSKRESVCERFRGDEEANENGEGGERFRGEADDVVNCEGSGDKDLLEPFIGMEFDSPNDAQKIYNAYAKRHGFTIRCSSTKYDKNDRTLISRDFVCSKEGFRPSKNVRLAHQVKESRTGCKGILRVQRKRDTSGRWLVTKFSNEHNHELFSPSKSSNENNHELVSPSKSFILHSHKNMSNCQKSMVDILDDGQIMPSKMIRVMEVQKGEQLNLVGSSNQDLRNCIKRKRKLVAGTNSRTDEMLRYNDLLCMFIKLAERGSKTLGNYNIAIKIAEDGLARLCDDVPTKDDTLSTDCLHDEKNDDAEMNNQTYLLDPEIAKAEGRHPSDRLKPFFEKIHLKSKENKSSENKESLDKEQHRRRTCSTCHEKGHDMRTCKVTKPDIQQSKENKSSENKEALDKEQLRRRTCSNCHEKGHDMRTCKVTKPDIQQLEKERAFVWFELAQKSGWKLRLQDPSNGCKRSHHLAAKHASIPINVIN